MVKRKTHLVLIGTVLITFGFSAYILGAILGLFRALLMLDPHLRQYIEIIVWYSALPIIIGAGFISIDLITIVRNKRNAKTLINTAFENPSITVVLTAYNDELSIGESVCDFISHPLVKRVLVVSNNSTDNTILIARKAGAIVFNEEKQGYGACVLRSLNEAVKFTDTEVVVLCEGDMTFRAYDLPKFIGYLPHADLVNGTRIVEQLQDANTQLSMFMHYGNFAVGKLLEMKYLGDVTLSDVGTTYKAIRTESLKRLLPYLIDTVNLEFNPYLLDTAIGNGFSVLECPITFHPRVGKSKGGNISNAIAFRVGISMIIGILFGWKGTK